MLKPIRILLDTDKDAIWAIFEFMADQPRSTVERYEKELLLLAELISLTPEKYEDETGLHWNKEPYLWGDTNE